MDNENIAAAWRSSQASSGSAVIAHSEQHQILQVVKSTIWGLGAPQGFSATIHSVNSNGTVSREAAYHTSKQWWIKQKFFLPPDFKLFVDAEGGHTDIGPPQEKLIANVHYKGWEGLISLKSEVEITAHHQRLTYVHEVHAAGEPQRKVSIRRKCAGREYDLTVKPSGLQLVWKGSKKALDLFEDDAPRCQGNLKLINNVNPFQPELLALWRNRTDLKILGSLVVFESALEGEQILLEEILGSCLAIVLSERLTTRGWIGGLGI